VICSKKRAAIYALNTFKTDNDFLGEIDALQGGGGVSKVLLLLLFGVIFFFVSQFIRIVLDQS